MLNGLAGVDFDRSRRNERNLSIRLLFGNYRWPTFSCPFFRDHKFADKQDNKNFLYVIAARKTVLKFRYLVLLLIRAKVFFEKQKRSTRKILVGGKGYFD